MSHDTDTDKQRLLRVLDAYGADPARWPPQDRQRLSPLLAAPDPEVTAHLAEARTVDSLFKEQEQQAHAPSHLMGAVLNDADRLYGARDKGFLFLLRPFVGVGSGLAFALMIGILVGILSPNLTVPDDEPLLNDLAWSDSLQEWELGNGSS
ncbi:hypothetical protein [Sneathiella chinensis]|uniref:Dihydroorotate dehydrogenase n=1 Tax=Sneathiella chinensis TaxID=349750 RepID=A0ABQ5U0J3_9PROT|nr:hypothetical protein [Sneathiella chinensis]GLQ05369.1 hypothetical protein GCM10007924_05900 [Sneathiella chinensis]